jgi:hypothetical protein
MQDSFHLKQRMVNAINTSINNLRAYHLESPDIILKTGEYPHSSLFIEKDGARFNAIDGSLHLIEIHLPRRIIAIRGNDKDLIKAIKKSSFWSGIEKLGFKKIKLKESHLYLK